MCHQSEFKHSSILIGGKKKDERKETQGSLGEAIALSLGNFVPYDINPCMEIIQG